MMINVVKIPWEDILHAVPAFLTIVLMPLTYSIAYGNASPVVSLGWQIPLGKGLHACWADGMEQEVADGAIRGHACTH